MARLAGPVTAAANLLGEATTEDLATEVRKISTPRRSRPLTS